MGLAKDLLDWLGQHFIGAVVAVATTLLVGGVAVFWSRLQLIMGRSVSIMNSTLTPGVWELALPLPLSQQQLQRIETRDPRELHDWLIQHCGGLDYGQTELQLTLQGRSAITAVIKNIRVQVVSRTEAATGALIRSPNAGAISSIAFGFDLTTKVPTRRRSRSLSTVQKLGLLRLTLGLGGSA